MMSKRQRRDLVVGTVLTVVVVVFIICHSLKCVINIIELAVVLFGEEISDLPHLYSNVQTFPAQQSGLQK
jgi:hypothetical protein